MKIILKVTLMIALLGSSVLADGQMGSGGCNGENCPPPPPPCTENCGGFTMSLEDENLTADSTDIIVVVAREFVEEYFFMF